MSASESTSTPPVLRFGLRIARGAMGLIVLAAAVGIFAVLLSTAREPARVERERMLTTVRTVTIQPVQVPRQWEGYGTARAMRAADVSAQITARVIDRPEAIEEGVAVRAGEVIAELDPVDVQSALVSRENAALAIENEIAGLAVELRSLNEQLELGDEELEIERRVLERFNEAQNRGGANPLDVDQREATVRRLEREISALRQRIRLMDTRRATLEAQLADAESQIRRAKEDVARATITSPIDGIIQTVEIEEGELLSAGQMVARVVDLSVIEIPLRLPVSSSRSVRVGDRVEVRSDGPAGGQWAGRVSRIAPEADAARRTITVYAEVRQSGRSDGSMSSLLLPGQFVTARVLSAVSRSYAIVPRSSLDADRVMALGSDGDGGFVARSVPVSIEFMFEGSYPTIHPIETQWAAIEAADGVPLPERVIVSNLETIRDGSSVNPVGAVEQPMRTDTEASGDGATG